jgi:acyl-coenzyme A thioesterase PaaI-like protein
MGLSCVAALGDRAQRGLVTVSLNVDYVGAAKIGQWLQVEPRIVKAGTSLAFADALVTAEGNIVARANASFKV